MNNFVTHWSLRNIGDHFLVKDCKLWETSCSIFRSIYVAKKVLQGSSCSYFTFLYWSLLRILFYWTAVGSVATFRRHKFDFLLILSIWLSLQLMVSDYMILFLLVGSIFYSRTAGCCPTHPKNVFFLKSTHCETLPPVSQGFRSFYCNWV